MSSRFASSRVGKCGVLGASLGLALGGVAACGDDFSNDCLASRTCPVAESAGAAGQAAASSEGGSPTESSKGDAGAPSEVGGDAGGALGGAGGAAEPGSEGGSPDAAGAAGAPVVAAVPDCTSNADCDDKLGCNGAETCDADGHCAVGKPPVCVNPDAVNCSVACVERPSNYECIVTANDTDHDGHASALCAKQPGDDCNDAQASVFTGAPELCDRVDNDCDKKVDLADGLAFAGKASWVGSDVDSAIRAERAVAAWSSTSQLYGVFWRVRGKTDLVVALYDAKGARQAGPTTVGYSSVGSLAIGAGATGFAVAWNSDSEQKTGFRTLSAAGQLGAEGSVAGRFGVADAPLALAWSNTAQRWEIAADRGLASVGVPGYGRGFVSKLEETYQVEGLELVAAGSSFVLGVSGRVGDKLVRPEPRLYRYDASGTLTLDTAKLGIDKTVGASVVHVAARPDGSFAAIVPASNTETSQITAFDAAGGRACAYTEPARVSDLTGTAAGYTLALFGTPATTHFRELSASCEAGLLVPTGFGYPYSPSVVASPTSYLNLWADTDGNSLFSIFGANYCN
ncbi:MAG TPA: putative metal-binding motif-containing protein [Polyangiaceae bacterium]|nr:putative metal-binding motif-containing protein [Polyangiaceae bacterium]